MSEYTLPECPCGSQPDNVTWTRGRTETGGPINPGRITFDPCGHVLEAPSQWYAAAAAVLAHAAEQPEGSDRGQG